jgi:hypothetical protein
MDRRCCVLVALAALTVVLAADAARALTQYTHRESQTLDTGVVGYREMYGEPISVTLDQLSTFLGALQRKPVRVSGHLERGRNGLLLKDGVDQVLLIPTPELSGSDMLQFFGKRVEVVGLAREIPSKRKNCGMAGGPPVDCYDPGLPLLPERGTRFDLPENSVTFWAYSDATPLTKPKSERSTASLLQKVAANPQPFLGKPITVLGRYRGGNMFDDLPADTRCRKSDWVIAHGEAAIWVTGKKPQGKGWRLSLDEESDSRFWIEVTGKVEEKNGSTCLEAKTLLLKRSGPE